MTYRAPVSDYQFILENVLDFDAVLASDSFSEVDAETAYAILEEAGKLASDVIAPLDRGGDLTPAVLKDGVVNTSPGFSEALAQVAEGGWIGMLADPENGGMGLPLTIGTAVNEMMSGACLSLSLYPLMCQGQIRLPLYFSTRSPSSCSQILARDRVSFGAQTAEARGGKDVPEG